MSLIGKNRQLGLIDIFAVILINKKDFVMIFEVLRLGDCVMAWLFIYKIGEMS